MAPSLMETEPEAPVSLKKIDAAPPAKDSMHGEYQYLNLIREILDTGEHRPDRYIDIQRRHKALTD